MKQKRKNYVPIFPNSPKGGFWHSAYKTKTGIAINRNGKPVMNYRYS